MYEKPYLRRFGGFIDIFINELRDIISEAEAKFYLVQLTIKYCFKLDVGDIAVDWSMIRVEKLLAIVLDID